MCKGCQLEWEESGEKERADKYAAVATEHLTGSHAQKEAVLSGIAVRAMVDFLFRMQKSRMVRGQAVDT